MRNPAVPRSEAGVVRGTEWLLSPRSLAVRLGVLLALAVGYLLCLAHSPSWLDCLLGLTAVLLTAGGAWFPLGTSLATTAVLALGFEFGHTGPVVAKVAAGVALAELAARRGDWRLWAGAGGLAGAYLLHPVGGVATLGYRAVVMAALPVAIGALLRTARTDAERVRQEARDAEHRHVAVVAAARATERTAIARELHDLIAHHVSSTVLRVGVAQHTIRDIPPAVDKVLDDIHASGKQALIDLRKLVVILRDPQASGESFIAPADLPAALDAAVQRAGQLGVRVRADIGEVAGVDALSALTLLRLTQEGLANVVKHAGSGTVAELAITVYDEGVDFLLCDMGVSVPPGTSETSGLGLTGLSERVALLGGVLDAGPTATGWRLGARLPTKAAS
ncbi:sensor histidine kinase [Nocardia sp. NPDC059240]|uniref:sensor histidine kinase n=1 Tax=Nocardia sp. NPDC059240 TaxID=3346786 RepID=UPI0036810502